MKSLSFLKYYLLYYIFALIYTTDGLLMGEDMRTIWFMFGLSLFLSTLFYLYNSFTTLLGFIVFQFVNFPIGPYLFPIIIGIIFSKNFITLINQLDMGVHKFYWIVITIAFVINLLTYYFTRKEEMSFDKTKRQ